MCLFIEFDECDLYTILDTAYPLFVVESQMQYGEAVSESEDKRSNMREGEEEQEEEEEGEEEEERQ